MNFISKIDELYNVLKTSESADYKLLALKNAKKDLHMEKNFSFEYYKFVSMIKEKGVVYTPEEIARYIVQNTISSSDIIENPLIKIADPACGSGNIIIQCFKYLRDIYLENLDMINKKHKLNLSEKDINSHIIKYNLYGYDIDVNALKVLSIDLFCESLCLTENFWVKDYLIDEVNTLYNIFLGNPPYIGQKAINKEYSAELKKKYITYKDKGDISYCFFQRALEHSLYGAKLSFITSRYFLESPSGEELRKILKGRCSIYKIVDFYGIRPFKNVGVDPVIIFLKSNDDYAQEIEVIKPLYIKGKKKSYFYDSLFFNKGNEINKFYINKVDLNDKGWILRNNFERSIIKKIEKSSVSTLSDICESFQGIITGCDKAFIVDSSTIENKKIETELIRPWIKSKLIDKYRVKEKSLYIIYSDAAQDITNYPNALRYIERYKEKLSMRRECRKGIRKWYELQWGRKAEIFEGEKIIFPYKSSNNRFALDKGSYFSADIYSLILKPKVPFTYEHLLYILNSSVYEFYFKTFGKKLGEDIYEYYPNNVMKLWIPPMQDNDTLDSEEKLYKIFDFTEEEIEIIKDSLKNE